jgi:hypothetical protein
MIGTVSAPGSSAVTQSWMASIKGDSTGERLPTIASVKLSS